MQKLSPKASRNVIRFWIPINTAYLLWLMSSDTNELRRYVTVLAILLGLVAWVMVERDYRRRSGGPRDQRD